jgi:hypothetical protein
MFLSWMETGKERREMMRKGYLLLLAALLLVIPGISQAATIYAGDLVNAYSGTYSLWITDDGDADPNTYHATLSVQTNTVSNAYIDWFLVHFDTPASDITGSVTGTNITTATATGTWVEGTGTTVGSAPYQNVYGYANGTFPTGNSDTGAFETGIGSGGTTETGGFLLNGDLYAWEFDFTSATPILGQLGVSNPNLQVGFYGTGVNGFPRLSQEFKVPEANTLMLIISGIVGSVVWRRKKRIV